jgi:hypothetical protein
MKKILLSEDSICEVSNTLSGLLTNSNNNLSHTGYIRALFYNNIIRKNILNKI